MQALFLILAALFFYSVGLWFSRSYNYLLAVGLFTVGLILDAWGTWLMYQRLVHWEVHSLAGVFVFFLMGILVAMGFIGVWISNEKLLARFRRAAPWIYAIWVIDLILGAMVHMF